jgi:signal transduction histidine kinase
MSPKESDFERRISQYIEATERLKRGEFDVIVPDISPIDDLGRLGQALVDLAQTLENRYRQLQKLVELTSDINAGLWLDNILEKVYENFLEFIPYNRIGFSLIEQSKDQPIVRAYWAKTDQPDMKIGKGYSAPLAGSSLETIIKTGQPRIINDLQTYLEQKPTSDSTRLIVAEGMRASLTCPLIANGIPVGFMFFSSIQQKVYADVHIDIFQSIAGQLAVILEKGRLVSELASQKAEIERQNKELRALNDIKNKFLGMAAHDLRGPLGNIELGAHVIRDMKDELSEEEAAGVLDDIVDQTGYMLNLINDLLDVAQIESGNLDLNLRLVNLRSFLKEAVQRHSKMAVQKNTKIELEAVPDESILADSIRLRQVIDNLISNAVKYSPPSSIVMVWVQQLGTGWRVNIKDQGPGITYDDRKRLFEDFARLSAKPTGGEKSVGLGLAITKRIIEAHGGRIDVESVPGQGATFWFSIPQPGKE